MTEQSEFLEALGVTVDGVPVDQAFTAEAVEPARVPNAAGIPHYHWGYRSWSSNPDTIGTREASVQQATFSGRALLDFHNTGQAMETTPSEELSHLSQYYHDTMDSNGLSDDEWRSIQPPDTLLLGEENYWDSEDEESMADSEDGYSDPEKILCQSDQEFGRQGHLFLVKWKNCSILRSSWEWESESFANAFDDRPQFQNFLKSPHPIRMEWESRKHRIARGEEERFDVHNWHDCVRQEENLRKQRRVLRRWKRKLEGIRRVFEAQQMDAEADWHPDMMKRMDKEDRMDKEKEEREIRKTELERKRSREDEDEEVEDGSAKKTA